MNTINQMCLPALPGYAPRGTKDRASQARLSLAGLDAALGAFIVNVLQRQQAVTEGGSNLDPVQPGPMKATSGGVPGGGCSARSRPGAGTARPGRCQGPG